LTAKSLKDKRIRIAIVGLVLGLTAISISLSGCGGGPPAAELIEAKGVVRIDGQPAEGIMVQFVPKTLDPTIDAPTSQAVTDANGEFVLKTMDGRPGVMPGEHIVNLVDTHEERPSQGDEEVQPDSRLAPEYSTKGIEVTVVEGETIEIDATSN